MELRHIVSAESSALASYELKRAYEVDKSNGVLDLLGGHPRDQTPGPTVAGRVGSQRWVMSNLLTLAAKGGEAPARLLLKGNAGVGKSVAIGRLARILSLQYLGKVKHEPPLPIVVEMQQLTLDNEEIQCFTNLRNGTSSAWNVTASYWVRRVNEHIAREILPPEGAPSNRHDPVRLSVKWLDEFLSRHPVILMIDGLDEFLVNHPGIRFSHLQGMLSDISQRYMENGRLTIVLGVRSSLPRLDALVESDEDIFEILPLTQEQITISFPEATSVLALDADEDIASFLRTPLIVSRIGSRVDELAGASAVNRSQVIEWALQTIIEKSRLSGEDEETGETISTQVWLNVLMLIGWRFFARFRGEVSTTILIDEVLEMRESWFEHLDQISVPENSYFTQALRVVGQSDTCVKALTRTVFLPTAPSSFRFSHRIWEDYLAARYLAHCVRLRYSEDLGHRAFTDEMFFQAGEQLQHGDVVPETIHTFYKASAEQENWYIIGNLIALLGNSVAPIPEAVIRNEIIANVVHFPLVARHVVLGGLSYRALRNLDGDHWASGLREALLPSLREHVGSQATQRINRVTESLAWCYIQAFANEFGTPPPEMDWPSLWGTDELDADALEFVCTPLGDGRYTFDDHQRSLQLAFTWYIPGAVGSPHKAIMATHYLHMITTAWLHGFCDQEIHMELPAIMRDHDLSEVMRSYYLVPALWEIWSHCESEVAARLRGRCPFLC